MAGLWSAPGRKALSPWNICLIRVSLYSDCACELSSQWCLTLFNPLNCSLPGSSGQKMRRLDSMSLSKLRELVMDREASHDAVHGVAKSWTWLSDWTELQYIVSGIIVVQLLSCVQLFASPWMAAHQAFLSFIASWNLLKFMPIESVMPSNHLILCCSLLLLHLIFPSLKVFSSGSALHIRWPKYWSASFSISPSNEYLGLISCRINWFDFLAVQGTLKSLL